MSTKRATRTRGGMPPGAAVANLRNRQQRGLSETDAASMLLSCAIREEFLGMIEAHAHICEVYGCFEAAAEIRRDSEMLQ